MATWTAPTTWATNDVVGATALNTDLRDNPLALKKATETVTQRRTTDLSIGTSTTNITSFSYDFENSAGVEYLIELTWPGITQSAATNKVITLWVTANSVQVGSGVWQTQAFTNQHKAGIVRGLVTTAAGLSGTYTVAAACSSSASGATLKGSSTSPVILSITPKNVAT